MKDLTGKRFGSLTVIKLYDRPKDCNKKNKKTGFYGCVRWLCKCDCGNEKIIYSSLLLNGSNINCGCKKMSRGEYNIRDTLNKFNVNYIFQYTLLDLLTKRNGHPVMDFAIFKKDQLLGFIEYQGIQHYVDCGKFGKQQREETDSMKKKYCKEKHVPLFEIKYNESAVKATENILYKLKLIS